MNEAAESDHNIPYMTGGSSAKLTQLDENVKDHILLFVHFFVNRDVAKVKPVWKCYFKSSKTFGHYYPF